MITDRLTRKRTVVTPHTVITPDMAATQQAVPQQAPQQPEVKPQQAEMPKAAQPALNTVRESIKSVLPQIQQQTQAKPEQTVQTEQTQETTAQKPLTYQDMIDYLKQGDEEYEKKKARNMAIAGAGDVISSIANLVAVNKGAANAYTPALTNAYRDYYDKLKAQRDADNAAMMNYYFKNVENEIAQEAADREQANKDREYVFNIGKQKAAEAAKDRELKLKEEAQKKNAEFIDARIDALGKDGARKDKIAQAQINKYNASAMKDARGSSNDVVTLYVDSEKIDIPKSAWNEANINRIYEMLPLTDEERLGVKSTEMNLGMPSDKYRPATTEDKMERIGKYMNSDPDVANAIRELAGLKAKDYETDFSQYEDVDTDEDFEQYLMTE